MEKDDKKLSVIDLAVLFRKMKENKKAYFITLPIVFILSCLIIICVPRTYSTTTTMAPEISNNSNTSSLADLATSFGIDISKIEGVDAISPLIYPDLMNDNGFVAKLFNIKIQTYNNEIKTTYYNYMKYHQKRAWWDLVICSFRKIFNTKKENKKAIFDPYQPSQIDEAIMEKIRNNITIAIDKKNGTISISVTDQDAFVCKTLADSTRSYLQKYITEYRTSKARRDVEYYKKLTQEAKIKYQKVRQLYGSYSDANVDVILESFKSKTEDLENEMQLKFNTYSALNNQLQTAQAKLQERTPAFTTIQGASVPTKPSGPKRMIFVLAMTFAAFIMITLYSLKEFIFAE